MYTSKDLPNVVFITLSGEYDVSRVGELNRQFDAAQDADIVLVDIREVTYVDSSALSALIRLQRRISWSRPGMIRLIGARPHVQRVLEITALDQLFGVFPGVREALGSLGYMRCIEGADSVNRVASGEASESPRLARSVRRNSSSR